MGVSYNHETMILPNTREELDSLTSTARWTEWITSDHSPERLHAILALLEPYHEQNGGIYTVRYAGLLLILGRTDEALAVLHKEDSRLAQAQRLLVYAHKAQHESCAKSLHMVLSSPSHFGIIETEIFEESLEAQMRLSFARGCVQMHFEMDGWKNELKEALFTARMLGSSTTIQAIEKIIQSENHNNLTDVTFAGKLAEMSKEAHVMGNSVLSEDLARRALSILYRFAEFEEMEALCESIGFLPKSRQWSLALHSIADLSVAFDEQGDSKDEFISFAYVASQCSQALRMTTYLKPKEAKEYANNVLSAPTPKTWTIERNKYSHQVFRIMALLLKGEFSRAGRQVRDQLPLYGLSRVSTFIVCSFMLEMLANHNLVFNEMLPRKAFDLLKQELGKAHEKAVIRFARQSVFLFPNTLKILADLNVSPYLQEVVSHKVIDINELGAFLSGGPVSGFPASKAVTIMQAIEDGDILDDRVGKHRYIKAVDIGLPISTQIRRQRILDTVKY